MEPNNYNSSGRFKLFKSRRPHFGRLIVMVIAVLIFVGVLIQALGFSHQISILNPFVNARPATPSATPDPDYAMPVKDPNRLNILVMGIRGENDPDAVEGGPLLTDSIQVFSFDPTTKKSSLISVPRDLLVTIHDDKKDKLNSAYEYGLAHSPDGLKFIKERLSRITGVYMDQVVIFDFSSFKQIVDSLGGVDVTLAAPFSESKQWGNEFSLPAGLNHLDGQNALYYSRSRYSSSDFDRSRRQQQVMFAIKNKLLKLNFLTDPVKSFSVLNLIRSDVKTDIGIWNLKQLLDLANQVKFDQIKKTVISTDNLLDESTESGTYLLTPKGGNLTAFKQFFQDSLQ